MKLTFIAPAFLLLTATGAIAQDQSRPPRMPIAEIAAELGVSESIAQTCLRPDGAPARGEERADRDGPRSEAKQAALLECLQGENSDLTAEELKSVMQSFRPRGGGRP